MAGLSITDEDKDTDPLSKEILAEELKRAGVAKVASLGGVRIYECPLTWFTSDTHAIIFALSLMADGTPMHDGGWADQPYWLVEAYKVYTEVRAQWQARQKKQLQSQYPQLTTPPQKSRR